MARIQISQGGVFQGHVTLIVATVPNVQMTVPAIVLIRAEQHAIGKAVSATKSSWPSVVGVRTRAVKTDTTAGATVCLSEHSTFNNLVRECGWVTKDGFVIHD